MNETYFFDTYALFELLRGSSGYKKYNESKGIITLFNLAEFNYNLKKELPKSKADKITREHASLVVKVDLDVLIEAMDLKSRNRRLSIPDAIGYITAKKLGIKFLTGDEDFRHLDNVEFVK